MCWEFFHHCLVAFVLVMETQLSGIEKCLASPSFSPHFHPKLWCHPIAQLQVMRLSFLFLFFFSNAVQVLLDIPRRSLNPHWAGSGPTAALCRNTHIWEVGMCWSGNWNPWNMFSSPSACHSWPITASVLKFSSPLATTHLKLILIPLFSIQTYKHVVFSKTKRNAFYKHFPLHQCVVVLLV